MCDAPLRASPHRFQIQPSQLNYWRSLEHVGEEQMGENFGNACGIWDSIKNQNKMKVQKSTKELLKHVNCLKKSFQHPVEKGKDNNECTTGLAQTSLARSRKESSGQPLTQGKPMSRKGAAHLTHRKISTFPFRKEHFTSLSISCCENGKSEPMHVQVNSNICFALNHFFFFLSCVAFAINIGYCHIFHLQLLLHTFSISSLWKPTLLYHLFYISVLLHWDCVEMWLYRVDCMPSSAECSCFILTD